MSEGESVGGEEVKTEESNVTNGPRFNIAFEQNGGENTAILKHLWLRADLLSDWSLGPGLGWSF